MVMIAASLSANMLSLCLNSVTLNSQTKMLALRKDLTHILLVIILPVRRREELHFFQSSSQMEKNLIFLVRTSTVFELSIRLLSGISTQCIINLIRPRLRGKKKKRKVTLLLLLCCHLQCNINY
jgi:hypothetical protein